MTKVLLYSDPHLGLKRQANMTPTSAKARDEETHAALSELLDQFEYSICVGDFFDVYSNSEETIFNALPIAEKTKYILAGNHDIKNVVDSVSSLRLIDELYENCIFERETWTHGDCDFYFLPHCFSQQEFDEELAAIETDARRNEAIRILFLHANYANDLVSEDQVSLHLPRDRAKELLATFNYIFIGHEHLPREDLDGRVQIVGSFRPTAFDNLCDKRVLLLDTQTGKLGSEIVWSAEEHAYSGPASQAPEGRQYYDLIDDLEPGQAQKLVVKLFENGAYGVRLRIEDSKVDPQAIELSAVDVLPTAVATDLNKNRPDLVPYYNELYERFAGTEQ